MIFKEPRGALLLRPWWDVAYSYILLFLIGLGILLLFTSSGQTNNPIETNGVTNSITSSQGSGGGFDVKQTTSYNAIPSSSHDELQRNRRNTGESPGDESSQQISSKSHGTQSVVSTTTSRERTGAVEPANSEATYVVRASTSTSRTIEEAILDTLAVEEADIIFAEKITGDRDSNSRERSERKLVLSSLTLFVSMWIIEEAFTRVFYSNHLLRLVCELLESFSSVQTPMLMSSHFIYANSIYRSSNRKILSRLFCGHNILRVILVIFGFIIVGDPNHPCSFTKLSSNFTGNFIISLAILLLLLIQICLMVYAMFWQTLVKFTTWGKLMSKYAKSLEKIDVARGRCVPSPPFESSTTSIPTEIGRMKHSWKSSSRFSLSASVEYISSGIRPGAIGQTERVAEALNPYTTNSNIKLILDLAANSAGVGIGLKCLAALEKDVHNNWQPLRPSVLLSHDNRMLQSIEISWQDPLAVLYLAPVPDVLRLNYGIEIRPLPTSDNQFGVDDGNREIHMEIVGYKETRYFKNISHYRHKDFVEDEEFQSGSVDSINNPVDQNFIYKESFTHPNCSEGPLVITIWTIIDGQLIAKSSVKFDPNIIRAPECQPHHRMSDHMIPKPPRSKTFQNPQIEEEEENCQSQTESTRRKSLTSVCSDELTEEAANLKTANDLTLDEESEIELKNFTPGNRGDEKVIWTKTTRTISAELEPISFEEDFPLDGTTKMSSIILSDTPSDSSLSSDETPQLNLHQSVVGEKRKKLKTKRLDKSIKAKSLTSLKHEGLVISFGRRCKEYNVSDQKISSEEFEVTKSKFKYLRHENEGILRKAKSTGHPFAVQLNCPEFVKERRKLSSKVSNESTTSDDEKNIGGDKESAGFENGGFDATDEMNEKTSFEDVLII